MVNFKKIINAVAPPPDKSEDGRDAWPSRAAFLLASCGGAIGMGNVIRYPSQVFNNHGLQWFIPYLMAIFLLAIPTMMLEIAIGQAYRGGTVTAYNNMSKRLKGTGLGMVFIGFTCTTYFVPILAWIMKYFEGSFHSPLPWTETQSDYFMESVIMNEDPIPGTFNADGSIYSYTQYPGNGLIGHTTGWNAFTWFLVWLCMCRGAGVTGRAVYFTMGLPIVTIIILIGRGVSLENASRGIRLYFATWRGETLAEPAIWQAACGQVFFSTGVGFGYYTAYASYNSKFANAVQDAVIIVCSNCLFEAMAAFSVFGVIGFMGMFPEEGKRLGSFDVGFLTYPVAITEMPGANFWSVVFFATLMLLGISSAFAMLDAVVTLILDVKTKWSRFIVATAAVIVSFLLSLMYCTRFGYWLLDGIDRWLNNISLVFIVWSECVSATSVYRYKDVIGQVGLASFASYIVAYFGAQIFGVAVAHAVSAPAGAGMGFGLYIAGTIVALLLAKTTDAKPPRFWGNNTWLSKFWYLAFYQGNQLHRDLNAIISVGKNWSLPVFWAPLLRYVAAPILAIIFGFAYPQFHALRNDPVYILGFIVAHVTMIIVVVGLVMPRWLDVFIPPERRDEGITEHAKAPLVPPALTEAESEQAAMEAGASPMEGEKMEREVSGKDVK